MYKTGKTSTTPPLKRGNPGKDSKITYYWSSDSSVGDRYFNIVNIDGIDSSIIQIGYVEDYRDVDINDMIFYSETNKMSNFLVTEVNGDDVSVKTLESWTYTPSSNLYNDIDIDLSFNEYTMTETYLPHHNSSSWSDSSIVVFAKKKAGSKETNIEDSSIILLNTTIRSKTSKPLGGVKITLEFYIDNISPAMDTMIMPMYNNSNTTGPMEPYARGEIIPWIKTYRGFHLGYSRYMNKTDFSDLKFRNNFDDEKIDNFSIILKDYSEYTNAITANISSKINKQLLHQNIITDITYFGGSLRRTYKRFDYKCYLFAYIPANGGFYRKKCLGEVPLPE